MKYIAQPDGSYTAVDENSEAFKALNALSKDRKPEFLDTKDSGVVAYLAVQAEAVNLAQAQAFEREAIDEIIREQFSKEIAARVKEKQSKR